METDEKKATQAPESSNMSPNHSTAAENSGSPSQKMKQMTLFQLMNSCQKLSGHEDSSDEKEKKLVQSKIDFNKAETPTNSNEEKKKNKEDGDNKLTRWNVEEIIGGNYDKDKNLIFAVKLKNTGEIIYTPYSVLKAKMPVLLCKFFESHIAFV